MKTSILPLILLLSFSVRADPSENADVADLKARISELEDRITILEYQLDKAVSKLEGWGTHIVMPDHQHPHPGYLLKISDDPVVQVSP